VANAKEKAERLAPMRAEIEAALSETPPPTVHELSVRLGRTCAALKYHFPELCAALLKRIPERKRFFDQPAITLMEQASKEEPAPSMPIVAARVGKSAHRLRMLHADLFQTIKDRHRQQRSLDAASRLAAYKAEITSAIADLRQRGIRPSRKRVVHAIPCPSMSISHVIDQLIATTLHEVEGTPGKIAGGNC
jgi:hypothetical protein